MNRFTSNVNLSIQINNLISCHKVLTGLQKSVEPDRERIQQVEAEIAELEGLL